MVLLLLSPVFTIIQLLLTTLFGELFFTGDVMELASESIKIFDSLVFVLLLLLLLLLILIWLL